MPGAGRQDGQNRISFPARITPSLGSSAFLLSLSSPAPVVLKELNSSSSPLLPINRQNLFVCMVLSRKLEFLVF